MIHNIIHKRFDTKRALRLIGLLLTGVLAETPASAAVIGKITMIEVSSSGYDFRVYVANAPLVCTGGSNFAYTLPTESNFNAYVSVLLTAYTLGRTVTIYTSLVNSQCKITGVNVGQ